VIDVVIGSRLGRHGRGLGHAVADRHLAHVHAIDHLAHHLDRARGAGHNPGSQRGEIELAELRPPSRPSIPMRMFVNISPPVLSRRPGR